MIDYQYLVTNNKARRRRETIGCGRWRWFWGVAAPL